MSVEIFDRLLVGSIIMKMCSFCTKECSKYEDSFVHMYYIDLIYFRLAELSVSRTAFEWMPFQTNQE